MEIKRKREVIITKKIFFKSQIKIDFKRINIEEFQNEELKMKMIQKQFCRKSELKRKNKSIEKENEKEHDARS